MSGGEAARPGGRPSTDRVVGVVAVLVGVPLYAWTYTFRVIEWDPLGMAFWPRVLLGLIIVLGVVFALRGWLGADPPRPLHLRAFGLPAGGVLLFVAAPWLGFLPTAFVLLTLLGRRLHPGGRAAWPAALAVAALGVGLAWLLFEVVLQVRLPRGALMS